MVWTLVEPGVAIVAASLATIRPLLRAWRVRGFDSTRRTGKSSGVRSGTNRSAQRGTIDMEDPKHGTAVELGPFGAAKGGDVPYGNFSRPRMPSVNHGQRAAGPMHGRGYVIDGGALGAPYENEDAQSSISTFDVGREAHSQDSGRVGLGPGGR